VWIPFGHDGNDIFQGKVAKAIAIRYFCIGISLKALFKPLFPSMVLTYHILRIIV